MFLIQQPHFQWVQKQFFWGKNTYAKTSQLFGVSYFSPLLFGCFCCEKYHGKYSLNLFRKKLRDCLLFLEGEPNSLKLIPNKTTRGVSTSRREHHRLELFSIRGCILEPKETPAQNHNSQWFWSPSNSPRGANMFQNTVLTILVAQDSQLLDPNQVFFGIPYPIGIHGTGIVTYISPCPCGHFSPFM